eukprot:1139236-Pelagomonas_calceolata.AAC.8
MEDWNVHTAGQKVAKEDSSYHLQSVPTHGPACLLLIDSKHPNSRSGLKSRILCIICAHLAAIFPLAHLGSIYAHLGLYPFGYHQCLPGTGRPCSACDIAARPARLARCCSSA